MNVFVLSTGRCGSMTFERACSHIENYTSAHESRASLVGDERLNYPPDHIESDNRLAWFLGRLERRFPRDVFYVHLKRDRDAVARSYAQRWRRDQIMPAYAHGIYMGLPEDARPLGLELALDYVDTVTANIELFLRGREEVMTIELDQAHEAFPVFWERIGACGDLKAARAEFAVVHNAS